MRKSVTNFQDATPSAFESGRIETTLYDLIQAVNEVVTPTEQHWVPWIVHQMLKSGRTNR